MPVRGIGRFHGKKRFVGHELWKAYVKKTGDKISYADFAAIIDESVEEVKKWILREPIGFQVHPKFGNIAVNKFKPDSKFKHYLNTSLGPVRNHNLHTGGQVFRLQWFHSHLSHASRQYYWYFKACRSFNRALAAVLKSGKSPNYNSYMQSHFLSSK